MLRLAAYLFGLIFITAGILGFIPMVTSNNMLFGYLYVNTIHNLMNFVAGLLALMVGSISIYASRQYFRIVGIISLLFAILGFFVSMEPLLWIISNRPSRISFHFVIAIVSLYLGYYFAKTEQD